MSFSRTKSGNHAFSLLELLLAVTLLAIMTAVLASIAGQTAGIWQWSQVRIKTFQSAQMAFETITRNLRLATLNAYWEYDDPDNPRRYLRQSDLGFYIAPSSSVLNQTANTGDCIFFYAPRRKTSLTEVRGLDGLITLSGFYVEYGNEPGRPGFFDFPDRHRFRLMQSALPGEESRFARFFPAWNSGTTHSSQAYPVADNVLAIIFRPMKFDEQGQLQLLGTSGVVSEYDTTLNGTAVPQPDTSHQLPPVVEVTLIAIDETSYARRYGDGQTSAPTIIPNTLFQDPEDHEADLTELEDILMDLNLEYRIFSTRVGLPASRWSGSE